MPVGIDAEAKGGICLCVVRCQFAVELEKGGAMFSTDVQAHGRRVVVVERVAVYAAVELGVLDDGSLLESRELTLVDSHVAVDFISRFKEAVVKSVVDGIR